MSAIEAMIASGIRPPQVEPIEDAQARVMNMRHLQQLAEKGDIELQNAKLAQTQQLQAVDDDKKARELFVQSGGQWDKFISALPAAGVSPAMVQKLQTSHLDLKQKLAGLAKEELANQKTQHEAVSSLLEQLQQSAPEQRAALWPQLRSVVIDRKYYTPDQIPDAYPGDDWLALRRAEGVAQDKLFQQALDSQKNTREQTKLEAELPGIKADSQKKTAEARASEFATLGQAVEAVNDQAGWDALAAKYPLLTEYFGSKFSDTRKRQVVSTGISAQQRVNLQLTADRDKQAAEHQTNMESIARSGQTEDARHHLATENIAQTNAAAGPEAFRKGMISIGNLKDSIQKYGAALEKYDNTVLPGTPAYTALQSQFTDLQMQMKELYNLGAITGPDMALLNNAITDPTSMRGRWADKKGLQAQLNVINGAIERSERTLRTVYNQNPSSAKVASIADVEATAKAVGKSVEQVKQDFIAKGWKVQ